MQPTPEIDGLCPIDDAGFGVVFGRRGGPIASAGTVLGNISIVCGGLGWKCDLRVSYRPSLGGTSIMTEWIDALVTRLSDDQKERNLKRAVQLRHADIIKAGAPAFFKEVLDSASETSRELNEKLGATLGDITFNTAGDHFAVRNSERRRVSLDVKLNLAGHQIEVVIDRHGPSVVSADGTPQMYKFKVGDDDDLRIEWQGDSFHEGEALASHLMQKAFEPLMVSINT